MNFELHLSLVHRNDILKKEQQSNIFKEKSKDSNLSILQEKRKVENLEKDERSDQNVSVQKSKKSFMGNKVCL